MKINIIREGEPCNHQFGDVIITDNNGNGVGCEHCDKLPPFTGSIYNNGWWCINCFIDLDMGSITRTNQEEIQLECLNREKKYIKNRYNKLFNVSNDMEDILKCKIDLLDENIACVHQYLDKKNIPRKDEKGHVYSIIGRIKKMELEFMRSLSDLETSGIIKCIITQYPK